MKRIYFFLIIFLYAGSVSAHCNDTSDIYQKLAIFIKASKIGCEAKPVIRDHKNYMHFELDYKRIGLNDKTSLDVGYVLMYFLMDYVLSDHISEFTGMETVLLPHGDSYSTKLEFSQYKYEVLHAKGERLSIKDKLKGFFYISGIDVTYQIDDRSRCLVFSGDKIWLTDDLARFIYSYILRGRYSRYDSIIFKIRGQARRKIYGMEDAIFNDLTLRLRA